MTNFFLHYNIVMANLLALNIFTVLRVCWMTAVVARIVSIKPHASHRFLAVGSRMKLSVRNERSKVRTVDSYRMDEKLSKIYFSPQGYWKGIAAIKKLVTAAKCEKMANMASPLANISSCAKTHSSAQVPRANKQSSPS